jgi:hypothetical protein
MNEMLGNKIFVRAPRLSAALARFLGIKKTPLTQLEETSRPAPNPVPDETHFSRLTKGRKKELQALEITTELFQEGAFPAPPDPHSHPYLTIPWSRADLAGYDLFVPTDIGIVGIQIKSSYEHMEKFIKEHRNGKTIPVVAMNRHKTEAWLRIDLKAAVLQAYRTRLEHVTP